MTCYRMDTTPHAAGGKPCFHVFFSWRAVPFRLHILPGSRPDSEFSRRLDAPTLAARRKVDRKGSTINGHKIHIGGGLCQIDLLRSLRAEFRTNCGMTRSRNVSGSLYLLTKFVFCGRSIPLKPNVPKLSGQRMTGVLPAARG